MINRFYSFLILSAAALLSLCFAACGQAAEVAEDTVPPSSPGAVETLPPDDAVPAASEIVLPDVSTDQTFEETEPSPSPEVQEDTGSVSAGAVLDEHEKLDDSFFADAAFFGNSLVEGLGGFGGIENASFFAHASNALYNLDTEKTTVLDSGVDGTLYEAMTRRQFGKVYVLLGINEIGWDAPFFIERYELFLDRLMQDEPDADIYIMSLTPVTRETSESHEYFNMDRVRAYNEALLALAERTGCWYVDLCDALAGEDGFLPPERAVIDGIHFTEDTYPLWADYLRTHYADSSVSDPDPQ